MKKAWILALVGILAASFIVGCTPPEEGDATKTPAAGASEAKTDGPAPTDGAPAPGAN
jgi:hypothetical protein